MTGQRPTRKIGSHLAARLRPIFAIDVRGLAALRVGLGLILLYDTLVLRIPWATALLSDEGVLTRELAESYLGIGYWTLYGFDGSPLNATVLLGLQAAAAVGLLVGWQTRAMTIVCLVLVWSVQARNPLILSGGDALLRALLWWSVFLPLGAVGSVDAWRSPFRRPARYVECSLATTGILVQMALMYLFAGIAKCNGDWLGGEAIGWAMQLEMFAKPAAGWLLQWGGCLPFLTVSVVALELIGPFLLFSPWRTNAIRMILLFLFCGMHIGIWSTLSIGIFSATAMVGWVLFVPSRIWDLWWGRPVDWAEDQPADYPELRRVANAICGAGLVAVLTINFFSRWQQPPRWYRETGQLFARVAMLDQAFDLWGHPPRVSPEFTCGAELADGSRADLSSWYLQGSRQPSESLYARFPNQSWRLLHWTLRGEHPLHPELRQRFLEMLVAYGNETLTAPVERAQWVLREYPLPRSEDEGRPPRARWAEYPRRKGTPSPSG